MTTLSSIRNAAIEDAGAGGLTVYATKEDLPTSGLTAGDQAYVSASSRLYVSNGSGWYNIALINATPSLSIDPTGTISLSTTGETTTITLTATDSDNAVAGLTYSVESDGNFGGLATLSQDSSVFTITPLSEDSSTTASAVLTFKASDGISFGTGDRTLSLSFKVVNSNYTTLMLKADTADTDNQVDASTSVHSITENGNVTSTAFTPHHPGKYSTYFNGTSNSQILIKGESTLAVGTGDFSCSMWYKSDGALDGRVLASSVATTSTTQLYWNVSVRSDGALWLQTRSTANSGLQYWGKSATGLITANTWHHLVVARIGGVHYCAVDGVEDTTVDQDTATMNITAQEIAVGASNITAYQAYCKGYINDFNFCVGGAEYDLSSGNFTVPDEPVSAHANTKVLLANRPYIKDTSASPLTIDTIGSAVEIVRQAPFDYLGYKKADHGGSVYFDGTGDKMSIANSADFNLSSGSWTIECWVYLTNTYSKYHALFAKRVLGGGTSTSIEGYIKINTGALSWYDGTAERSSTGIVKQNTWSHCVWTHNGTNLKMYLNGENVYDAAISVTELNYPLYIGGLNGLTGEDFQGYISDFRVVKGTEVYTADFTPPTAPLTAITNTKLLTCTNKNDIWDTGQSTRLLKSGDVTASNTQRKFTTSSSIAFDGVQDAIEVTPGYDDPFYKFGTDDFTIEMWAYWTNLSGDRTLGGLIKYNSSGGRNVPYFYTSGTTLYYWTDGTNRITASSALTLNTWHHIALTRSGNDHKLFVDGTQVGSTWTNAANYIQGRPTWGNYYSSLDTLFTSSNNQFGGYLQSLRITRGLARYTGAFTPPTAEFNG